MNVRSIELEVMKQIFKLIIFIKINVFIIILQILYVCINVYVGGEGGREGRGRVLQVTEVSGWIAGLDW